MEDAVVLSCCTVTLKKNNPAHFVNHEFVSFSFSQPYDHKNAN